MHLNLPFAVTMAIIVILAIASCSVVWLLSYLNATSSINALVDTQLHHIKARMVQAISNYFAKLATLNNFAVQLFYAAKFQLSDDPLTLGSFLLMLCGFLPDQRVAHYLGTPDDVYVFVCLL